MKAYKVHAIALLCVWASACGNETGADHDGDEGSSNNQLQRDAGARDGSSANATVGNATTSSDAGTATSACDSLTYETFGQAFLDSYCVNCHGSALAQKRIRLDSLNGVVANKGTAKAQVTSGSMPPRGAPGPTAQERQMFAEWVDCGPK